MSPDELRAAAERHYHCLPSERDVDVLIDAARRLADVIEYAESVMRERSDTIARGMRVGTAETFLDIARGETNEREGNEHSG